MFYLFGSTVLSIGAVILMVISIMAISPAFVIISSFLLVAALYSYIPSYRMFNSERQWVQYRYNLNRGCKSDNCS